MWGSGSAAVTSATPGAKGRGAATRGGASFHDRSGGEPCRFAGYHPEPEGATPNHSTRGQPPPSAVAALPAASRAVLCCDGSGATQGDATAPGLAEVPGGHLPGSPRPRRAAPERRSSPRRRHGTAARRPGKGRTSLTTSPRASWRGRGGPGQTDRQLIEERRHGDRLVRNCIAGPRLRTAAPTPRRRWAVAPRTPDDRDLLAGPVHFLDAAAASRQHEELSGDVALVSGTVPMFLPRPRRPGSPGHPWTRRRSRGSGRRPRQPCPAAGCRPAPALQGDVGTHAAQDGRIQIPVHGVESAAGAKRLPSLRCVDPAALGDHREKLVRQGRKVETPRLRQLVPPLQHRFQNRDGLDRAPAGRVKRMGGLREWLF